MWDERYSTEEYAYGTKANAFLKSHANSLPKGKVLSLAEGEGRNAVFLAKAGYQVTAVDGSAVGLAKAEKLAKQNDVELELIHADLTQFDMGENAWHGIISIFFPLSAEFRKPLHSKVMRALKPGGVYLLEAYTQKQVQYGTGGGKNAELMQDKQSLSEELKGLEFKHLQELERDVVEGEYHTGLASVVQLIARAC